LDGGQSRRQPEPEIHTYSGVAELHGQRYERRLRPIEVKLAGLRKFQRTVLEIELGGRLHQALQIRHMADADERGEIRRVREPEFRGKVPKRRSKHPLDLGEVFRRAFEDIWRRGQAGFCHRSKSCDGTVAAGRPLDTPFLLKRRRSISSSTWLAALCTFSRDSGARSVPSRTRSFAIESH